METIVCKIIDIRFHNEENGFTILGCMDEKTGNYITVKCNSMVYPSPGLTIVGNGEWFKDRTYGMQFVLDNFRTELPSSTGSIEQYLGSGLFKGVGIKLASKIVDVLGKDTLEVISTKSDRLIKVPGISKKKAEAIWESWDKYENVRQLMEYLLPYNISTKYIIKIYKQYGEDAQQIILKNPYQLIRDIDGIGFKKADEIALKIGFDKEGFSRCAYGMQYYLTEQADDGHCYTEKDMAIAECAKMLAISAEKVREHYQGMINERFIITNNNNVYLPNILHYEECVADVIAEKIEDVTPINSITTETLKEEIQEMETEFGLEYNDMQKRAIISSIVNKITVVTGGPGTGKTTVTRGIIKALENRHYTIIGGAPTGKAAKRMSEVTGLACATIHRLLEYNPAMGYQKNEDCQFSSDVIIIDEMSMVNIQLMYHLCCAIPDNMRMVLIGDIDQLPCIGAGNVLHDIIETDGVPVVHLTEIFRQAQDSDIIKNAHIINKGKMPEITNKKNGDLFFIPEMDDRDVMDKVVELMTERLPKAYNVKPQEIQLLTPMRINGLGSIAFNKILQSKINHNKSELKYGDTIFRLNDIVMQIKNNYDKEVFNGDTGTIIAVNTEDKVITVKFDEVVCDYDTSELDELMLAYACTIHKSQGSEYPIVVIPIHPSQRIMLQRNLIYTAITRSKKLCVIVGDYNALIHGIYSNKVVNRRTTLREFTLERIEG